MIKWKIKFGKNMALRTAKYINDNGGNFDSLIFGIDVQTSGAEFNIWNVPGVAKPQFTDLPSYDDSKVWYSDYEKNKIQDKKSVKAKLLENTHIELIKGVLQTAKDPRGDLPLTEIPILSLDELSMILETLFEKPSKEKTAIKLALKLTNTNVALLKEEGPNWGNNASYHTDVL